MKKVILVLVSALTGSLLTVSLLGLPTAARAGGGQGSGVERCASENGDVNADGSVNLSDAVTILGHLFLGSPTELMPLCETEESSELPDSGQTKCFGQDGTEITCDSVTCPGQDGSYATGCPSEGRFTDNGDGTVTDHCTGLQWQKDTADINGDGQDDQLRWCDALAYCENLGFVGHEDWRLPNVREIQSLVDYGRVDPAIDPMFGAVSAFYWSSTSLAIRPDNAWGVGFDVGGVDDVAVKDVGNYVRAVRSVP